MLSPDQTTLICPENDLESHEILQLATTLGIQDIRKSSQEWGAELAKEPPENLANCLSNVIIIELPGPTLEEKMRQSGHTVKIIDHHHYSNIEGLPLDRSSTKTSLEQFAELFYTDLNDDQKLVALHDRGGVNALVRESDATLEQIDGIVRKELILKKITPSEIQQAEDDWKKRVPFYSGPDSRFKNPPKNINPSLTLVKTTLSKVGWLAHLAQRPHTQEKLDIYRSTEKYPIFSVLILTVENDESDEEHVVEVNFYGSWNQIEQLSQLDTDNIKTWRGGTRDVSGYLGGEYRDRHGKQRPCDCFADMILSELIGLARPASISSTYLMYPFKVTAKEGNDFQKEKTTFTPGVDWEKSSSPYRTNYFHPHVQRVLFSQAQKNPPIEYYEYIPIREEDDEHAFQIQYHFLPAHKQTRTHENIYIPLIYASIHRFADDICILTFQLETKIPDSLSKIKLFWQRCLKIDEFRKHELTWGQILQSNEICRKMYPVFKSQHHEGKFPDAAKLTQQHAPHLGGTQILYQLTYNTKEDSGQEDKNDNLENFNEKHWISIAKYIAHSFANETKYDIETLLDDRMVVNSFVSLLGYPPQTSIGKENHEAYFLRSMYVDPPGNGFEYNKSFIQQISNQQIYRRWEHYNSIYGFTRYSSSYVGFGTDFTQKVKRSFDSSYYTMGILALYYRSFLVWFSGKIVSTSRQIELCNADKEPNKKYRKDTLTQKKQFTIFSNVYWFNEVTNQDQGIELFDLYKSAFDFESMYNQTKEEIDRADELLEALSRKNQDEWQDIIGTVGLLFAIITIITGYFGMNFSFITGVQEGVKSTWIGSDFIFIIITTISIILFIFSFYIIVRRKTPIK